MPNNSIQTDDRFSFKPLIIFLCIAATGCQDEMEAKPINPPIQVNDNTNNPVFNLVDNTRPNDNEDIIITDNKNRIDSYDVPINNSLTTLILNDVYIVDGDTVHAKEANGRQIKIRLKGIDAPENSQQMGSESKQSLDQCISNSSIIKVMVDDSNATDKYGRYLGRLQAGNIDCNLYQVEQGMAWFYREYSNDMSKTDAESFESAERYAQSNKLGIWLVELEPAWEYRHKDK